MRPTRDQPELIRAAAAQAGNGGRKAAENRRKRAATAVDDLLSGIRSSSSAGSGSSSSGGAGASGAGGRAAAENRAKTAEAALQAAAARVKLQPEEGQDQGSVAHLAKVAAAAALPVTAAALFGGKGTLAHEKALRGHTLGGQSSAWDVCHAAASNLMFPNPNAPKRAGVQPVPDAFRALALAREAEAGDPGAWAPLASNAKGYTWLAEDQEKLVAGERRLGVCVFLRGPPPAPALAGRTDSG